MSESNENIPLTTDETPEKTYPQSAIDQPITPMTLVYASPDFFRQRTSFQPIPDEDSDNE